MNRRRFLQGVGGMAVAAPFLSNTIRKTRAATTSPKRQVLFYTPGGCITTRWFPQVENGPLTATDLSGTTIDSLAPLVGKLLVPRGITGTNAFGKPQELDPHIQGMGSKLTCALIDEETRLATGRSLDHVVAAQINPAGLGPLYVNPGWSLADPMTYISFSDANEPVAPVSDARSIYARLTGNLGAASLPTSRDLMRQSVLDVVRDDLQRFEALDLSQSDRLRVEQWMDLLRETEVNLDEQESACTVDVVAALGITGEKLDQVSDSTDPATSIALRGDVLMDLMVLTLICDTNRSLMFSYPSFVTFNWDGIEHSADIDALNHRTGSATLSGPCYADVLAQLEQVDRWYASKFFRLINLLDSIPEGDVTLLDNTATAWLREFSDGGAFNQNNMPLVIAGSCGGYLKQGQAVLLEDEPIGAGNSEASCNEPGDMVGANTGTDSSRALVPINKLYVTLMNAVGCKAPDGGAVIEFGAFDGDSAEAGITDPGELAALRA